RSQNVENHDKVRGMFFERAAKSVKNMKKSCRLPKREHSQSFNMYNIAKFINLSFYINHYSCLQI
ncbi:MAG: hypothetical protein LBB87_02950, partial [Nitrososphaerota archaeon]|nr:hypothetical protein [Nitrososphaerota archaeon]